MQIIIEQRYVLKPDGKRWLQCKYLKDTDTYPSGPLSVAPNNITDWQDIPIRKVDWPDNCSSCEYPRGQQTNKKGEHYGPYVCLHSNCELYTRG